MMQKLKRYLTWALILFVALVLDYVLPRHDIARITGTEVVRVQFTPLNRFFYAQPTKVNGELIARDVRFINAVRRKSFLFGFIPRQAEGVRVYRNEDTGWIWPPYFKFDTSDLQAEALANISTPGDEKWVVITYYGWRNRFLSIYPNAVGIKRVSGPDVYPIPWFNIFFFVFLGAAWLYARAMWRQFRERTIDPALEELDESADEVRGRLGGLWRRLFGRR